MCHVHLQIAILLYHLAWYNIPAAHCMFQLQVRHGIGPGLHVDISQFNENMTKKHDLSNTFGPAKCRSPKCKHRLATPPLAQCKWKTFATTLLLDQLVLWTQFRPARKHNAS